MTTKYEIQVVVDGKVVLTQRIRQSTLDEFWSLLEEEATAIRESGGLS